MKKTARIAVTSRSFCKHPLLRTEIQGLYEYVTFNDSGKVLSGRELADFLKGHEKAIIGLEPVDEQVVSQLSELKMISKHGVGFDKIDLVALEKRGIQFAWTGGVNRRSVAELTLTFMITLLRHVSTTNLEVRGGVWQPRMGQHLSGRTVGIVGCGHIGKDLTALLQPFGCKILVHDIKSYPDFYSQHGITAVTLEELLTQSDLITLHVPLNATTRNLLSRERLVLLKPTAFLLNTARGGLVDEQALKEMLKNGRLKGAAFDVFDEEPPVDQELILLPNFIATPHIAGSAEEAVLAMGRAAIKGLEEGRNPREFIQLS